jgi:dTDP-4-amino-4,6-dideoxygalactose transaminase
MSDPEPDEARRMIPQGDPGASYRAAREAIDAAVARVLGSGAYVLGAEGAAFEAEFAGWLGGAATRVLGCGNGTDALVLALRALGVGPGSAVATVSHTAVATVAAIEMAGAVPVLLDVDPDSFTLDPAELSAVLADPPAGLPPIRAVIPVHLYGQPAELDAICAAAARHGAAVVEDCAQAHGASFDGRAVGLWGAAGTFSFYPTKNLGAFGDGGAVAVGDPQLAERVEALRQYGWGQDRISGRAGVNSRLDEIQAAVLRVKLHRLAEDNARRRSIAAAYDEALANGPLTVPIRLPRRGHVFHQYVIRAPERDRVRAQLAADGIGSAVHYPVPVHLQPAYAGRIPLGPAECRATETLVGQILSLPMHPHLSAAQVARVCAALRGL